MGIFSNLFNKKGNKKESGAISSNLYTEELRQIEENYTQGFISQEEYDFQFGLYTKWSKSLLPSNGLHVVAKGTFGDSDLYNISIRIGRFISSKFTINGEHDPDFCWLKSVATRPCFHHLCFTYKKTVYSCLIGVVTDDGELSVSEQDKRNFFNEVLSNCLYPCIIPINQDGDIYDENAPILDAKTLQPINFIEEEEFIPSVMTKYELYARALNEVFFYLTERGCTKIAICDIPGLTPSLWFNDEKGSHSYVIVRSVPAGLEDLPYEFNKDLVEYYIDDKGYFVNLSWNNLLGNNGDFRDKRIFKSGSYIHNEIALEPLGPLEVFEHNHPHFTFISQKLHKVKIDDLWDSSLEKISAQEEIRYKIYKHIGELKRGDSVDPEDIFGKGNVSSDEYIEFLKVTARLTNPYPYYESQEELEKAILEVKGDDAGTMYKIANTLLGKKDFTEAMKWYRMAFELDDSDAMCRLAGGYKYGHGVEKDMEQSLQLYKKAISVDGNVDALLDLGLCYLQGEGVPQNYQHGAFLMERSAKQGNMMAQYNMGVLYQTGRGVETDMEEALRWYHLSAAQGYEQAVEFLNRYKQGN